MRMILDFSEPDPSVICIRNSLKSTVDQELRVEGSFSKIRLDDRDVTL